MPSMDGFEFVRQMRQRTSLIQTPVIFYSATYLESEARNLAQACGVADIITKPAEPQQILDTVDRNLGLPPTTFAQPPAEEFRQKHLGLLLTKLSQKAQTVVPRLDAMIDLGLQLASERDPQQLLGSFCAAARKVIGAKYATVGVLDKEDRTIRYRFASGMNADIADRLTSPQSRLPVLPDLFSDRHPRRLHSLSGSPEAVGLPSDHPPVHSFLCAPIISPDHVYGWLCLADKIGSTQFNEEDEGLAQILAAQVGRIYENGSLYSEVKSYVVQLKDEIEDRKQAQEALRKLNAELEERVAARTAELLSANKELEAFSFSVSHDLRAPLRSIGGFSRILIEKHEADLPETVQRYLRMINDSAARMSKLIDDLLDFARINRHEIRRSHVDLTRIAQDVLSEIKLTNSERQVDCQIEPGLWANGDPNLLRIVLNNLFCNAWKFTKSSPNARIHFDTVQEGGETVYRMRDNGAGFDMKYAKNLFGAFQRLHSADEYEGTGIGLAIVQRIILRHGGRIWAEGKENEGATFYFTLPALA